MIRNLRADSTSQFGRLVSFLLACLLLAGCTSIQKQETIIDQGWTRNAELIPTIQPTNTPVPSPTPTQIPTTTSAPLQSSAGCTYSSYYWGQHPDNWLTENFVIGKNNFSHEKALEIILAQDSDPITAVLREFFVVELNILNGSDPGAIGMAMEGARDWLSRHPRGLVITEFDRQTAQTLADTLASYNSGEVGPGRCKDEPVTPTPTGTYTPTPTPTRQFRPATGEPANPPTATKSGSSSANKTSTPVSPTAAPANTAVPTSPAPTVPPQPTSTSVPPTQEPTPTLAPTPIPTVVPVEPPSSPLPPPPFLVIPTLPPIPLPN